MAIYQPIEAVALDIGGVLAHIHKDQFCQHLKNHGVSEHDFFDRYFFLFQTGALTQQEFLTEKKRATKLPKQLIAQYFRQMIQIGEIKGHVDKIKIPYFFMSNINEIHYEVVDQKISPSDFARQFSILSFQVGTLKPAASFFYHLEKPGMPKNARILFIDDQPHNLIEAQKHGLKTAYCPSPDNLWNILADLDII